MLQARRR